MDANNLIIKEVLEQAHAAGASDIFVVAGLPLSFKIKGEITHFTDTPLDRTITAKLVEDIFEIAQNKKFDEFLDSGDADFSFSVPNVGRFRINAYKQRSSLAAVMRCRAVADCAI